MIPRVILHNSVSLDGSLTNFEPNMELHYRIAQNYRPDAHLIGSNTIQIGSELYGAGIPKEEERDFQKTVRDAAYPYWVIPDTRGVLQGYLHTCRRFELCRAVIVLIGENTPREYVEYLAKRNYAYHVVGGDHVDLAASLELLATKYQVTKVLADTGKILGNLLLERGLVSEISLLIHPIIVGKTSYNIFGNISQHVSLHLQKKESFDNEYVWLVYTVDSPTPCIETSQS